MKDRIKELRKNKKLTQAEFGERIGVKGTPLRPMKMDHVSRLRPL